MSEQPNNELLDSGQSDSEQSDNERIVNGLPDGEIEAVLKLAEKIRNFIFEEVAPGSDVIDTHSMARAGLACNFVVHNLEQIVMQALNEGTKVKANG